MEGWTYARAGVDRVAIAKLHEIATSVKAKGRKVVKGPGGYAGIIKLKGLMLALHVDGVGTKTILASSPQDFETIGIDAVAMNVNDVICVGAKPLAVLDYITLPRPMPEVVTYVLNGIKRACGDAEAELVGGETAIMPDLFASESCIDVAAACLGFVIYGPLPRDLRAGDLLIGLASSGLHSNGFSLVRRLLLREKGYGLDDVLPSLGRSLREELLKPTRIYVKAITKLLRYGPRPLAIAHITGGGLLKTRRMLKKRGLALIFDSLPKPPKIFELIRDEGDVDELEMYKTFNMGIGMVLATREWDVYDVVKRLNGMGFESSVIGRVERGDGIYVGSRRLDT